MAESREDSEALLPCHLVQLAANAAQMGDLATARQYCVRVLAGDPLYEDALLWQNVATESMAEKIRLLHKILSVNPENDRARTLLLWTESRQRRGETISTSMEVDLLRACPYLGTPGGRHARFRDPSPGNVCHAEAGERRSPRAVSEETQRDVCLATDHLACPTYTRAISIARRRASDTLYSYFDFFGLAEEPFNIVPSPRFFYPSEQHERALQLLRQVIEHRQGLALLTGQVGLGKTLLLRVLYETLASDKRYTVVFFPHSGWGSEYAMLRAMLQSVGVIPARRRSLRDLEIALEDYLVHQAFHEQKTVVLLLDEAQNMTMRLLHRVRRILDMQINERQMAQIVLAGQPRLMQMVGRSAALKDRIVANCTLSPLSPAEVRSFIQLRLRKAGSQDGIFTPGAVRAITELTNGSPRRINVLCMCCLLDAFERRLRTIDEEVVLRAANALPAQPAEETEVPTIAAGGRWARFRRWLGGLIRRRS